ncbi:uncharacterized protein [Macaca nemestrina]|uniref:uncharacterized protein isoform X3 n=1 Tax=Macaca nemestrina TaxID=9545 RepID=UPI0039B87E88
MDGPEGQYAKGNKPVPRTLTDFPTRMWVIAQRSSVVMKESDSTAETPHSILRRVKWRNASEQTTHQGCGSCCYSEKEHLRGEKDTPEAFARSLFPETDSAEDVMWIRFLSNIWNTEELITCCVDGLSLLSYLETGRKSVPGIQRPPMERHDLHWVFRT